MPVGGAMITSVDGSPVGYFPVRLVAGEDSAPIVLRVAPDTATQTLRATSTPEASLLGRILGGGAYADLSEAPIDLSPYYGGYVDVEVIVRASAGLTGLSRASLFLGTVSGGAAGWAV